MFTFGIFTTHLPYLAFVFFYVYFLIFGMEKASDGKIQISEKSTTIEYHLNSFDKDNVTSSACYYYQVAETFPKESVEYFDSGQDIKRTDTPVLYRPGFWGKHLFCRPPPALA